jgi:hypothetical protein
MKYSLLILQKEAEKKTSKEKTPKEQQKQQYHDYYHQQRKQKRQIALIERERAIELANVMNDRPVTAGKEIWVDIDVDSEPDRPQYGGKSVSKRVNIKYKKERAKEFWHSLVSC